MPTIDADAHVVETEHTWDYMDPSDKKYRPLLVSVPGESNQYWMIDGQFRGLVRRVVTAEQYADMAKAAGRDFEVPLEARMMENVEARIHHMDELGIDVQVVYPTIFIHQIADTPEWEVPICLSYNRWLADIWQQGNGRLRWVCALPLLSIPDAIDQLRFSKENGAVAVFMRSIEGERLIHDPYFYPLYEEASRLDMCIGVHVGNANRYITNLFGQRVGGGGAFWRLFCNSVGAFHSVAASGLMKEFPELRIAFVECASDWLPYALKDLKRRKLPLPEMRDIMREYRMYVACNTGDDVPYVVKHAGEDNIVIGTDYGHTDINSEVVALRRLRDEGGLDPVVANKIVDDNPRRLYGL